MSERVELRSVSFDLAQLTAKLNQTQVAQLAFANLSNARMWFRSKRRHCTAAPSGLALLYSRVFPAPFTMHRKSMSRNMPHFHLFFVGIILSPYCAAYALHRGGAQKLPPFPPFDCKSLPSPPPSNNVNKLRPGNIQAIMGLGDSMTAGFAMHAGEFWDVLTLVEYRGDVYCCGGNTDQPTLPNFLKRYNPNMQGASIGYSAPLDAIKWLGHIIQPFDPRVTKLNGAQSGAKVEDVPAQVDYLTNELKTTYNATVNFEEDWKMLTILIGANNLCGACKNRSYADPQFYETQLELVLQKIHAQIPRVFVNLVPMFNISSSGVYINGEKYEYCRIMWDTILSGECECLQGDATNEDRTVMDARAVVFREITYKLANKWQAKNLSTFTVKIQPFISKLTVPSEEFLSDLDCFHPAAAADAGFALGLWNNLWTPQAEKIDDVQPGMKFKCPDENSFLQ